MGHNIRQGDYIFASVGLSVCPRRDGQAELACVVGYTAIWFTCLKAVTHPIPLLNGPDVEQLR